jgi:valyl-tRNA synthetase
MEFPKHYDPRIEEKNCQEWWDNQGLYRFDSSKGGPFYTIDTPPPTVSGEIHLGHVFSYVQAEVIARYWRMQGHNIFYPFGFDDNGLPTERYVERIRKVRAADVPRADFIKMCLEVTAQVEDRFEQFWKRLGFSVDWTQRYSTIDPLAQRVSQRSFLDLFRKNLVYRRSSPTLWCPECHTAIAQAELENEERPSIFFDIVFKKENGDEVIIATTRPELLPACVAVFVHPEDERHKGLLGLQLTVPAMNRTVPVLSDWRVNPEKGTGIVMCCTFGDTTDIDWWQEHDLPLRIIINEKGILNDLANDFSGLHLKKARTRIIAALREGNLLRNEVNIVHPVNTHERCGTEVEYRVATQWFIRILDRKQDLIAAADQIAWYPDYMKVRYVDWVENLKWDWCISRQRYYGVPFPVWYCQDCGQTITADNDQLPVDPAITNPPVTCRCGSGNMVPEKDIMDTWATSSITPLINAHWGEPDDRSEILYPMTLRPQAHDIIRTWAFYTIVKGFYHSGKIPWKNVMISGHGLDPERKKISKSKEDKQKMETPLQVIERNSADTVRYWASCSRVGTDTFFSEKVIQIGKRLVTKIWNASKFAITQLETRSGGTPEFRLIDRWLLSNLTMTVEEATRGFGAYDASIAKEQIERFFWNDLCDHYLEYIKKRMYRKATYTEAEREGAMETLHRSLLTVLKLFAPIMPHITDVIYRGYFAQLEGHPSIHVSPWPDKNLFPVDEEALRIGELAMIAVGGIRKLKTLVGKTPGTPCETISLFCPPEIQASLQSVLPELADINQAGRVEFLLENSPDLLGCGHDIFVGLIWGEIPPPPPQE